MQFTNLTDIKAAVPLAWKSGELNMSKKRNQKILSVVDLPFTNLVFTIGEPQYDASAEQWFVEVHSQLPDRSTFDIVWFRFAGQWHINDMFIAGDDDDGVVTYLFYLV